MKKNLKYIILAIVAFFVAVFYFMPAHNTIAAKTVARVDISTELVDAKKPRFEIYIDGSETPEQQAGWMPEFGKQGYVVQKDDGVKDIELKALNDANISIILRGLWEKDADGKMIEHWVKYNSVTVNGEEVLPEPVDVWHDKPFVHTINTKAGNEYKIHIEWGKSEK